MDYGSGGWDVDSDGNLIPRETNINSVPPDIAQPQPQPRIITTPNSSTGQPQVLSPGASEWRTEFATPQGGALTTTTPNSRTGAPAPGIRSLPISRGGPIPVIDNTITPNSMTMPNGLPLPIGGPLFTGAGLITNAPTTPRGMNQSANRIGGFFDSLPGIKQLIESGYLRPSTNPWAESGTQGGPGRAPSGPAPVIQGGPAPPSPPPPTAPPPPGPPSNLPPFVRGPLPTPGLQDVRAPVARGRAPSSVNLGYGAPADGVPPAQSSMFTTIDRPNADIAGGRSVAGQLAPQYFTRAYEPGGPAQMGALDLSGLFNRQPAPVAAAAPVARQPVQGPLTAIPTPAPRARAAPAQVHPSQLYPKIGGLGAFGDPVTSNLTPSQLSPGALRHIAAGRRMFF